MIEATGEKCREVAAGIAARIIRELDAGRDTAELRQILLGIAGDELNGENGSNGENEATVTGMVREKARRAGGIIEERLQGATPRISELQDIIPIPFGPGAAYIAALVVIHAIARSNGGSVKTRAGLLRRWEQAARPGSRERFIPITPMAARILRIIGEDRDGEPTRTMAEAAELLHDPATVGDLIQAGMPDENRKMLGTFHTRQASATLMARLSVPDIAEWTDPQAGRCRIADYSCGAGSLLRAAAMRVREIHAGDGGDPASIHRNMMERDITAMDILPMSVAIAVTELEAMEENPPERVESTGGIVLRHGPIDRKGPGGTLKYRQAGLGALDLLRYVGMSRHGKVLPIARTHLDPSPEMNLNPRRKLAPSPGPDLRSRSQDLVIMNPPFSRETSLPLTVPGTSAPPTPVELEQMRRRMQQVRTSVQGNGSMAYYFAMLAHRMVRPGGTISLLLPETALTGGGNDGRGWAEFRRIIDRSYRDVRVLGVTDFSERDSNFSLDTRIAEIILIGRRRKGGEGTQRGASFVSINRRPRDDRDAVRMADAILDLLWEVRDLRTGQSREISEGDLEVRALRALKTGDGAPWRETRVAQHKINRNLEDLLRPRRDAGDRGRIPITTLGEIAQVGPDAAVLGGWKNRIRDSAGWDGILVPALIAHECVSQRTIETEPNETTRMDPAGRLRRAQMHINSNCRYNSQPTTACRTTVPTVGGKHWPTIGLEDEAIEKMLALWMNTSMGLMLHWRAANRSQHGLGYLNTMSLRGMAVLDPRALRCRQIDEIEELYEETKTLHLLATHEAWRDENRMELDRRMLEILGLGPEALRNVTGTRNIWCREPTVISRKGNTLAGQPLPELAAAGG